MHKFQQEYINQFREMYHYTYNHEKAHKLLYQWIKTDCLKQRTVLELFGIIKGEQL